MCKIIFDAFETEEQAIAFTDWFVKHAHEIRLFTTQGMINVEYEGVDTNQTDKDQIVINICTFDED